MEMGIGIAGILIGIFIAVVPYFRQKYFLRPELTVEILDDGGSSSPRGLSSKNHVDEDGIIDGNTAIRVFELIWRFNLRITNNSDITAFYPDLEFNPNGAKFTLVDKLNNLQPIEPAETVQLKVEYRKYEEKTGQDRTKIGKDMPPELNGFGLLLRYQNSKKSKFYTLHEYNGEGNKNKFLKRRPKDYKKT